MKKSPKKKQIAHAEQHYALGNSLYSKGQYQQAAAEYLKAVKLNPDFSDAFNNLGNSMNRLGRPREALNCFTSAVQATPNSGPAYTNLGNTLLNLGENEKAAGCLIKAVELQPDNVMARVNLGNALTALGKRDDAKHMYLSAIKLDPECADAYTNACNILREELNFHEALRFAHKSVEIKPTLVEGWHNLASTYFDLGMFEEAEEYFLHALQLRPEFKQSKKGLLVTYAKSAQYRKALALADELLLLTPEDQEIATHKAGVLGKLGHYEEADQILRTHLNRDPHSEPLLSMRLRLCGHRGNCEQALHDLNRVLADPKTSIAPKSLTAAHFLIGDTYDRMQRYDDAFAHYQNANELKPVKFDRKNFTDFVNFSIEHLDNGFFARAPRAANDSSRPIFILGMPRSGSSLTEQILASHKDVYGAGELSIISKQVAELLNHSGERTPYPQLLLDITADRLTALGDEYLKKIDRLADGERLITDKMPQNFSNLALISMILPHARIIHTQRDAMDTCLSCYFQNFVGLHGYSYRLDDLGFYFREYARLMQHWQKAIPLPILNVSYEDLVDNTEVNIRRMLDFLDLEWDDNCLQFHESKRAVITASHDQVKQPIYKKSKQRWRNYEKHLDPLKEELAKSDLGLLD